MYLHGLESSNVCDKVDFMRERANVLAPSIDYRKSNIEEELMYMVESFQPDLIIGSSMGGYVGMMLANRYNIDPRVGLVEWVKQKGADGFDVLDLAKAEKTPGLYTHTNVIRGKVDMFPQQELIDMLLSL